MRAWQIALGVTAMLAAAPVAATGCHDRAPADCATAVAGAVDRMSAADVAHAPPPAVLARAKRLAAPMKRVMTQACTEDAWAADVIACVDRATTRRELDACDHRLTPKQHDAERKRMDEVLELSIEQATDPDFGSAGSGTR